MAITRTFNGSSLRKPGAYSAVRVNLTGGFPLASTGVVALVGEAEGGEGGATAGVLRFTSEDMAALADMYKSGPIVDAARLLIAPAKDSRVVNGASQILVYKTNAGAKSNKQLKNAASADLLSIESRNYGEDENLISVKVDAGVNPAARVITLKKQDITEILSENANAAILVIQYIGAGSNSELTIQGGILDIANTGAPADDISISLAGKTVEDVVDLLETFNGGLAYNASSSLASKSFKPAGDLDPIWTPLEIKSAPRTLRAAQKELLDIVNSESSIASASRVVDEEGQIVVSARAFLVAGSKGASTNAAFQAAFDALLAVRANIIVPLVSRDATALITAGKTDPASTFTLDAVNLQALTHCILASNTKNRSERNCYVSHKGSFADAQAKARALNHERASMLFQDVEILAASGDLQVEEPWAASCIVAGIQAGTEIGEPSTFKRIRVSGIEHADYNFKTQVDLAIDAGLCPLEEMDEGGYRIVVGNTTYGIDQNFVFNRVSVLEAADYVAYNLRQQLEAIFTGTKARTGSAESIKNTVVSIMSSFLSADITVGDDTNSGLGWKDLTVTINGNAAEIDITITPVQGIDFILARIVLDSVKQSA